VEVLYCQPSGRSASSLDSRVLLVLKLTIKVKLKDKLCLVTEKDE
jgi:hypothetical protein